MFLICRAMRTSGVFRYFWPIWPASSSSIRTRCPNRRVLVCCWLDLPGSRCCDDPLVPRKSDTQAGSESRLQGRQTLAGWPTMDRPSARFLPVRQGSVSPLPRIVPPRPREGAHRRSTELLLHLRSLQERCAFLRHLLPARTAECVLYAKAPFAGSQQVVGYVRRYTYRIAILQ